MFRSTFIALPVVFMSMALCLQADRTTKPPKSDAPETPQAIIATILRLEQRLDEAESHHRVDAVDELIADDYWGVTVGGGIITKAQVLSAVSGQEEASSESTDQQVRPMENVAIYTALVSDRGTDRNSGKPYTLTTRVMDVWQKRGREWKLVNDQATAVAPHGGTQSQP